MTDGDDFKIDLKHMISKLDGIREQRETELRKLLQNPTILQVAEQLMDEVYSDLTYLCNFNVLLSERDEPTAALDVLNKLQELMFESFKRVTGHDYVPLVVRDHHRLRKKASQEDDR